MSRWSRLRNTLRPSRLRRELEEEQEFHLEQMERDGRSRQDALRVFGSQLRAREESLTVRGLPWLDSLRSDVALGWRQILKRKTVSLAAILSLGFAIGACAAAFRLIDALLLRPLPIAGAERLYAVSRSTDGVTGKPETFDGWAYPNFEQMRDAVRDQADVFALSYAERMDITFRSDAEMEKAQVQYVSGDFFQRCQILPVAGRTLSRNDDLHPGADPYVVITDDYWERRFHRDPNVVGRKFHIGSVPRFGVGSSAATLYEIVGVLAPPFTGTEPGVVTDIFAPVMMHAGVTRDDWTWHRTLIRVKPGVALEPLRAQLHSIAYQFQANRAKRFTGMSPESLRKFLSPVVILEPAAAGISSLQRGARKALQALAVLVALVLLIACANVANLMAAQAASRAREMALRISIGAGRGRLIQLVLVESALIGTCAAVAGALFAWWAAPFVVDRINPPDNPMRLVLPADWHVLGFGFLLTLGVICLFGIAPALRASGVKPMVAMRGGSEPHGRRRLMHGLIGVQVTFCFLVLLVAGLLAASAQRLMHRPLGFSPEHVLTLSTVAASPQPMAVWEQAAEQLRTVGGVESVAMSRWPLLTDTAWNGFVSVNDAPPGPELGYFLGVSPGWIGTMKIKLLAGRDLNARDTTPGRALVNQSFVRAFFGGLDPVGRTFKKGDSPFEVVGVVANAPYRNLREGVLPAAYVPLREAYEPDRPSVTNNATFIVRTVGDPAPLADLLRRAVPAARPELRVSTIRTQDEIVRSHTVRERLMAMLSVFFAGVALLLAAIGLYGVLEYSVVQRYRELGIRVAIGAPFRTIARNVVAPAMITVAVGSVVGMAGGVSSARALGDLLFEVSPTDPMWILKTAGLIVAVSAIAALPAVLRASRIDPVTLLRAD